MKNQYFGDVGDFGKYGLLSALIEKNLKMGINWYLTNDDCKTDGKFINYMNKKEFIECDLELHNFLEECILENRRNVDEIKNMSIFANCVFFNEVLEVGHINALSESGRIKREKLRKDWFGKSLKVLEEQDIIFFDPDNGFETRSLSRYGKDSVKYVFTNELMEIVKRGQSIVVYNHRDRSKDEDYKNRMREIYSTVSDKTELRILRFSRYSVRDYLVFIQPEHRNRINSALNELLENRHWKKHFSEYSY